MAYYIIYNNTEIFTAEREEALTNLYPNYTPQILPADYNSDKYIVVEGELVLNPEYEDIMLERVKVSKINENDTARDEALNAGVEYKDVLFDSDTDQKVNLLATVGSMSDEDTTIWFGMDNTPLECSKQDLINIGGLITTLHTFCWTRNAEIKYAISEAETIEEVEAIEIDYTEEELNA